MILTNGILSSELLLEQPVVHGFTTRESGNLGYGKNPGDPDVVENRHKLFSTLGLEGRILVQPKQVHSASVVSNQDFVPGCEADASYGDSADTLHSILTADCLPVLVYQPSGIVAAI